jgi:hypothetical protein
MMQSRQFWPWVQQCGKPQYLYHAMLDSREDGWEPRERWERENDGDSEDAGTAAK